MPDILIGSALVIYYPQGEGSAEYPTITVESVGARISYGEANTEYAPIVAFGGDRIHFSTGFVAERRPQAPTVCLDAVSIVEWKSNALWKRASDKCKPMP